MKKLDSRIKKEEKEEKNFRKLIYQDNSFAIPPQKEQIVGEDGIIENDAENLKGGRRDRGSGVFLRS